MPMRVYPKVIHVDSKEKKPAPPKNGSGFFAYLHLSEPSQRFHGFAGFVLISQLFPCNLLAYLVNYSKSFVMQNALTFPGKKITHP